MITFTCKSSSGINRVSGTLTDRTVSIPDDSTSEKLFTSAMPYATRLMGYTGQTPMGTEIEILKRLTEHLPYAGIELSPESTKAYKAEQKSLPRKTGRIY